ncbi:hypothetical protein OIU74_026156 [Salix koriyanagi]|uniref:Uncharacterized protein n=1 Tax=Salix koriyanagi TaxID=2511006 RepID=A0A9Q1A6E3_9ROSI|nr:hypothetical protein OIU74_026156 [Salix koriyanagi]
MTPQKQSKNPRTQTQGKSPALVLQISVYVSSVSVLLRWSAGCSRLGAYVVWWPLGAVGRRRTK